MFAIRTTFKSEKETVYKQKCRVIYSKVSIAQSVRLIKCVRAGNKSEFRCISVGTKCMFGLANFSQHVLALTIN